MLHATQISSSVQKALRVAAVLDHHSLSDNYCEWSAMQALAKRLAKTLQDEIDQRSARPRSDWRRLELRAVHRTACVFATSHALASPTLDEVDRCEWSNRQRGASLYSWTDLLARRITRLYGA